jgi:hypothetical protein
VDITLRTSIQNYDSKLWDSEKSRSRVDFLQWPKPERGVVNKVFSLWLSKWDNGISIRADSLISYADAALKLLYYSKFCDDGLSYEESDQVDTLGFHLVPFGFAAYPSWEVQDPSLPLTAVFTDPKYFEYIGGHKIEGAPPSPWNAPIARQGVLRSLSYSANPPAASPPQPNVALDAPRPATLPSVQSPDSSPKSFQELLTAGPETGYLATNENGDTFFVTAIFNPEDKVHPVINAGNKLAIIMEAGLAIDPNFEVCPVLKEFVDSHPPITSVEEVPTAAAEIFWYMSTARACGNATSARRTKR